MKMKYLFAIGIFLFIVFAGCTQSTKEQNVEYETYSNEYFSIKYPENWDVIVDEQQVGFEAKVEDSSDPFRDGLVINVWDTEEGYSTLEDMEANEENMLYENEKVTSKGKKELNEYQVFEITSEWHEQDPEYDLKRKAIYVIEEGKVFIIEYFYQKGKEDKYETILEEMVNSFEVVYEEKEQPEEEQGITYEEYKNDYFSIKYPEEWKINETAYEDGSVYFVFESRLEGSSDDLYESLTISIVPATLDLNDIEDLKESEESWLYENEEIISSKEITFKGNQALEFTTEIKSTDPELTYRRVAIDFVQSDKIFLLVYIYEYEKEGKYLPIFEEMLNSFKIIYEQETENKEMMG